MTGKFRIVLLLLCLFTAAPAAPVAAAECPDGFSPCGKSSCCRQGG